MGYLFLTLKHSYVISFFIFVNNSSKSRLKFKLSEMITHYLTWQKISIAKISNSLPHLYETPVMNYAVAMIMAISISNYRNKRMVARNRISKGRKYIAVRSDLSPLTYRFDFVSPGDSRNRFTLLALSALFIRLVF